MDAQRAVAELLDIVSDFPFTTDADRAGWIAALLTPFAHVAYTGPAPLFWIVKNCPGIGGTKLVDVIHMILSGTRAAVSTYIHDVTETRKQITAWAIESPEIVFLDNVAGLFGNAPLSAAITGTTYKDRILGVSATFQGQFRPVWYATSNNGQLVGDMHRRVLPIRLETHLDHPEERDDFKFPDLLEHVKRNRGRLTTACLVILRAWHCAGRPTHKLTPFDFREWSGIVREAIVFAGRPDPPSHLERYLPLLHTGIRAILTGRVWHGLDGGTGRVFDLAPDARLPRNIGLLSVAGAGECWERFPSFVLLDFPDLFESETPVATRTPRQRTSAPLEAIAS